MKQDRNSVVVRLKHSGDIRVLNLADGCFFSGVEHGPIFKWHIKNIFDISLEKESENQFHCAEFDTAFDVSYDGNLIFGVNFEDRLKILIEDLHREKTLVELEGHSAEVLTLRHSARFNKLYSGGADKTVVKWNLNTYRKEHIFASFHSGDVQSLILTSDDRLLISGSKDRFLSVFETKSCTHVGTARFETSVLCLQKNSSGTKILCAGKDIQDLRVWALASVLKFCQQKVDSLRKISKGNKLSKIKLLGANGKDADDPGFETNLKRSKYEFGENFEVVDSMDQLIYEKKLLQAEAKPENTSIANNLPEEKRADVNHELEEIYKLLEQNKEVILKESFPTMKSLEEPSQKKLTKPNVIEQLKNKVEGEREKAKELREDIIKLNEDLLEKFTEIKDEQNGTIEKIVESNIVQFNRDEDVMGRLKGLERQMTSVKPKVTYQKKELEFANEVLDRELSGLEKALLERREHLEKTGRKLRKCYALRKKGIVEERSDKGSTEQVFVIKKKYTDYIFNYLKHILVESRRLEENSKPNTLSNSINPLHTRKSQVNEIYGTNKSDLSDLSGIEMKGSTRNGWGLKEYEHMVQELEDEVETLELETKRREKQHWNLSRDCEKLNERVYRMDQMGKELKEKKGNLKEKAVRLQAEMGKSREYASKDEFIRKLLKICDSGSSNY